MSDQRIWVFGEVLFDHFPDNSRVLGGAPFNVAWHLQAFGQRPLLISRVGDDPAGAAVRRAMRDWGMDTSGLQVDPKLPTGRVTVRLTDGSPQYAIESPAAYDAIAVPQDIEALGAPRLLYHGTLALREKTPRVTLQRVRDAKPSLTFVDVNLREPFWRREEVREWLRHAHWAKLNRDELDLLSMQPGRTRRQGLALVNECGLEGLVVTRGENGAVGFIPGGGWAHSSLRSSGLVVDTVGAGDAFAAVMILGLVSNCRPEQMLARANTFARAVCGWRGATVRDHALYQSFLEQWDMA